MSLRTFFPSAIVATALVMGVAGCGQSTSNTVSTSTASSAHAKHSATTHKKHPILRGKVVAISTSQLQIKNKKGKTFTFSLSSKTHYREKKITIASSAVKVGSSVAVRSTKSHGQRVAHVVRVL